MSATKAPESLRDAGESTNLSTPGSPQDIDEQREPLDFQTNHVGDVSEGDVRNGDTSLEAGVDPVIKLEDDSTTTAASEDKAQSSSAVPDQGISKKRKRGASPPWNFPTAQATTLKTEDGRRVSARFNTATPGTSDNDATRGRSSSLSAPPAHLTAPNSAARSRPASPPWKSFGAAGPSSIQVDGKRKSGRVNKELADPPKRTRVSPRSAKKQEQQAALSGKKDGAGQLKQRKSSFVQPAKKPKADSHSSQPDDSASQIAELRAKIKALQPSRSFTSPGQSSNRNHKRKNSDNDDVFAIPTSPKQSRAPKSPDAHRPSPRIKIHFNGPRRYIQPPHRDAKVPLPIHPPQLSVFQAIENHELRELQQPYTENERGPPDMAWFLQRAERQAVEEGAIRRRLLKEAEPGGKLSEEKLSIYQDADPQPGPPKQHGHLDHLTAHALFLRQLQLREKTAHRALAKKVAHEALEAWKARRGPTEEDLREEADRMFKLIYRQVVVDVKAKWEMVTQFVRGQKIREWEAREEEKRQQRLREKLRKSEIMVKRQRGGDEDESAMDEDDRGDENESESESGEENMSDSSEEEGAESEEEEAEGGEMGADELAAYLAQREAEPPDPETAEADDNGTPMAEILSDHEDDESTGDENIQDNEDDEVDGGSDLMLDPSGRESTQVQEQQDDTMELLFAEDELDDDQDAIDEEFEPKVEGHESGAEDELSTADHDVLHTRRSRRSSVSPVADARADDEDTGLSSDESTDMDSTDYDSDEDMSSTGDEADGNDDADDEAVGEASGDEQQVPKNSLLSLFKDEVKKWAGLPTPTTSAEGDEREHGVERETEEQAEGGAHLEDKTIPEPEGETHGFTEELAKDEKMDVETGMEDTAMSEPDANAETSTRHLVPQPALLRGTLRSYQHAGLDWLASLYRDGTNGILADEMGLGKTIQTIALLAHLAEEHEIWETHLVIVPTSVILNWVTEFQKFLPGFRVLGYYGTADERQIKRKGWVNDPHHAEKDRRGYNVVVTSYNVAMQDINAIRNVQWHYLVLDEAHNIRNFQSQRWQVLIRLKTRARLLLTGTPLQNSLTELWSLLTFLTAGDDDPAHGDLEEFLSHWKEPVREIFDRGVSTLSEEAQRVVEQLHVSLRPFLLRRLKSEVEKDLPTKTEEVVVCKLSKRQRQLYQEYMGLAETRRSLQRGNAVSAGKVLLSLRRVCNHPDLFDPRPVQTSFALEISGLDDFVGVEALVRRLLGARPQAPDVLLPTGKEASRRSVIRRARKLDGRAKLAKEAEGLEKAIAAEGDVDVRSLAGCQALQRVKVRTEKLEQLRSCIAISRASLIGDPIYGADLRELVTIKNGRPYRVPTRDSRGRVVGKALRAWPQLGCVPLRFDNDHVSDWLLSQTSLLQQSVQTVEKYAERLHETMIRFAFCTPVATAPILTHMIAPQTQDSLRAAPTYPVKADPYHTPRARTTIAFPDSRLLIYDAGKLQRLTSLLRMLQSQHSRSLIFTQMTGTLNILETFLSLLSLPYLRLDGSTPVERRQLYAAEFNRPDSKYQVMILSSRAGGIGLNLTGASSVIFYDLDWNPQMDRQCMDRAHRIGQVRDVRVFKMVSERTVEENILRRAEQKSLLDRTVIQEGHFTTDFKIGGDRSEGHDVEGDEDVEMAIERFLGGGGGSGGGPADEKATAKALESVEEKEDVLAAQRAGKEEMQADEADFAERRSSRAPDSRAQTPGAGLLTPAHGDDEGRDGHVDGYMIRFVQRLWEGVQFVPAVGAGAVSTSRRDKHGRDRSHRPKRRR